jgi:hypothetical protein
MSNQTEDQVRESAARRAAAIESQAKAKIDDPGAPFKFHSGKALPGEFKNPPAGTPYHRCLDPQGHYRPDWSCIKIHKTTETQADRVYAHGALIRGPHKVVTLANNYVRTGVWVDVPPEVLAIIKGAVRETMDMVRVDGNGNDLGLTGPGFAPSVTETRPQYHVEVVASA